MPFNRREHPTETSMFYDQLSAREIAQVRGAQSILRLIKKGIDPSIIIDEQEAEKYKREEGLRRVFEALSGLDFVRSIKPAENRIGKIKLADYVVKLTDGNEVWVRMKSSQSGLMRFRETYQGHFEADGLKQVDESIQRKK